MKEYILLQWDNFGTIFCNSFDLNTYLEILQNERKETSFKLEFWGNGYFIKKAE